MDNPSRLQVQRTFLAAGQADVNTLRGLLEEEPLLAVALDENWETPLHKGLRALAEMGTMGGWQERFEQVVKLLLMAKATANAPARHGDTPLKMAARVEGAHSILRVLLEARADPKQRDGDQSSLMLAAMHRDTTMCRMLLEAKADPQEVDSRGQTAAVLARRALSNGCATLLESWASPPATTDRALSAASSERLRIDVKSLSGAVVADLLMCPTDNIQRVKQLVSEQTGFPIHQQRLVYGETVLDDDELLLADSGMLAENCSDPRALTLILADPREANEEMLNALDEDDPDMIWGALRKKADPNLVNEDGASPIMFATCEADVELLRALCNAGADATKSPNPEDNPPIYFAVENGHTTVVEELLRLRADPNTVLPDSSILIHTAVAASCGMEDDGFDAMPKLWNDILQLLLDAKADPHARWGDQTPMLIACRNGDPETVGLLLEARCSLDPVIPGGSTPLLTAVEAGHSEVVSKLIAEKANIEVSAGGVTPLALALNNNSLDCVEVLRWEGGAKCRGLNSRQRRRLQMFERGHGRMI